MPASEVLVVDDQPDIRAVLRAALQREGYAVREAAEAEGALLAVRERVPDLVILDVVMPGEIDGVEACRVLKRRPECRTMPVLLLTAKAAVDDRVRGLDAGADDFLGKPFETAELLARVRSHLRTRALALELERRNQELTRLYQALAEAERVKDDLTHMLVHDLKNPISSVLGTIDLLVDGVAGPVANEQMELLKLAREESAHLLHLAGNILDVRRMQEGKLHLRKRAIAEVEMVIRQALGDAGSRGSDRRVSVAVPKRIENLVADPEILRRVFANLLSNAFKHTRKGGRIEVFGKVAETAAEFQVIDDGEGLPEDDLERIFNRFEQSRATVHERFDTGMGLTFCRLAVQEHGGKIWATSALGKGATFTFTLPLGRRRAEDDTQDDTLDIDE